MNEKLKEKVNEAFASVLPITLIVLILSVFVVPLEIGNVAMFLVGAVLLIIGMGFFSLGADMAMMPMGEGMGIQLSKFKKIGIASLITLIMGFVITIAEPDLQVLAEQVRAVPNNTIIWTVAFGVGLFLMIAVLRILFNVNLSIILIICYTLVFLISFFVPKDFLSVAFDSGGVTTGPITVPFIMAFGVGLSALRSDKNAASDSFGLVALSSVGPIMAVMFLGIFYNASDTSHGGISLAEVVTMQDVMKVFAEGFPDFFKEVVIALVPILLTFLILQIFSRRFKGHQLGRVVVGFIYTFIGLVMFLTGVNVGFLPVGYLIGNELANMPASIILIPLGMLMGYFIVAAEPAVHVLNKQVEEITNGAITQKAMNRCLSIGVAFSVALSMIRILTSISIYWIIIPGYLISIILTFFVPKIFVGIAFDSGGVASGPMTSTFLLPFAIGACEAVNGEASVMTDAFGIVAMVAMTPLIAIQIMGVVYNIKLGKSKQKHMKSMFIDDIIIEYEEDILK